MTEGYVDQDGVTIINETDVPTDDILPELRKAPEMAAVSRWLNDTRRSRNSLFERDRFVTPENPIRQMMVAKLAVKTDDIVSSVLESTESLAFSKLSIESEDQDEEDVWNQVAADLELDARLREMWRELFTCSQFYAFMWWGRKTYKVRGRTSTGNRRKKAFNTLSVPTGITLLDPTKIVPVGTGFFNREKLIYCAEQLEAQSIMSVLNGDSNDDLIQRMILEPFTPSPLQRKLISDLGLSSSNGLFVLNPATCWRHTLTRPSYEQFAEVRMVSVFELLDMKQQLREMDRAHLIGATNFIVLVKKGSDTLPAKPEEIGNLQASVRTLARVPVIVGDHRLNIEIITPKIDTVLNAEKYSTIDSRVMSRLYQMFTVGGYRGDDTIKAARVIARGLESRRHMLRRAIERYVLQPTYEVNQQFSEMPRLEFHPQQIALDFDSSMAAFLIDLRDRNEISRDTLLSQIDLDQTTEARKREREKDQYDDIFQTIVPYSGVQPNEAPQNPAMDSPRAAGRTRGGNRNGGGRQPGGDSTGNSTPGTPPPAG